MSIIIDTWCQDDCTLGRLSYGDFHCFTLELPWLGNKQNVSCIPAGTYQVTKYASPRHGSVLLLHDVPNRSYIEIHAGNYTRQIKGCILPGRAITYLDADQVPDVTSSRATLNELLSRILDETTLEIRRCHSRD